MNQTIEQRFNDLESIELDLKITILDNAIKLELISLKLKNSIKEGQIKNEKRCNDTFEK
ncbi:hypothetical protein SDC9_202563 [bioreactor metagenome]|uniref:Uncharacterized protein n=1 Tax=bioreactor metagenome TaxID=1076179 RepID=A0A645ITY5_9ZZZZ